MCRKAAGVILAVITEFAGRQTDIDKDDDGRAVSVNIFIADDTTAKINANYVVSCGLQQKRRESQINERITKQPNLCDRKGYQMIVASGVNLQILLP